MNKDFSGKSFLLFAPQFFGYDKEIARKIEMLGALVDLFDERANATTFEKVCIRLHLIAPVYRKVNRFYRAVIDSDKKYDYVIFFNAETVSKNILQELKNSYRDAKFILYMWDSFRNKPYTRDLLPYFDKVLSFNKSDCDTYNLFFRPLFYIDKFDADKLISKSETKYDISFTGTIQSDRYFVLQAIKRWAIQHNLAFYFFMYFPSKILYIKYRVLNIGRKINRKDFCYEPKPSSELSEILQASRIIIDIQHPKQTGLTMRTIEMLGLKKKLITTNKDVVDYDFYDEKNIFIIDRKNPQISMDFLASAYNDEKPEIRQKYALESFVKELIE